MTYKGYIIEKTGTGLWAFAHVDLDPFAGFNGSRDLREGIAESIEEAKAKIDALANIT